MYDFIVAQDGGSVFLLIPQTDAAKSWVSENLPEDAITLGDGVGIEGRYFEAIANGIQNDGLTIA